VVNSLSIALRSFGCAGPCSRTWFWNRHYLVTLICRQGNVFCVGPQSFEAIVLTRILPENVDDHIAKVHQHPLR